MRVICRAALPFFPAEPPHLFFLHTRPKPISFWPAVLCFFFSALGRVRSSKKNKNTDLLNWGSHCFIFSILITHDMYSGFESDFDEDPPLGMSGLQAPQQQQQQQQQLPIGGPLRLTPSNGAGDDDDGSNDEGQPTPKRQRISRACETCRNRKVRPSSCPFFVILTRCAYGSLRHAAREPSRPARRACDWAPCAGICPSASVALKRALSLPLL